MVGQASQNREPGCSDYTIATGFDPAEEQLRIRSSSALMMKRTDDERHPHDQQGAKRDRPYQEPGSNVLPGLAGMVVVALALSYHPLIHDALLAGLHREPGVVAAVPAEILGASTFPWNWLPRLRFRISRPLCPFPNSKR